MTKNVEKYLFLNFHTASGCKIKLFTFKVQNMNKNKHYLGIIIPKFTDKMI